MNYEVILMRELKQRVAVQIEALGPTEALDLVSDLDDPDDSLWKTISASSWVKSVTPNPTSNSQLTFEFT